MVGLRTKQGQRVLMSAMALVALAAMGWSLLGPLPVSTPTASGQPSATPRAIDSTPTDFAALSQVADAVLRPKLDISTPKRHMVKKVPLPADVRLIMTMIESDRRSALFSIGDGDLKLCQEGEVLGDITPIEVVAIQPATAVVRFMGQESRLTVRGAKRADDG